MGTHGGNAFALYCCFIIWYHHAKQKGMRSPSIQHMQCAIAHRKQSSKTHKLNVFFATVTKNNCFAKLLIINNNSHLYVPSHLNIYANTITGQWIWSEWILWVASELHDGLVHGSTRTSWACCPCHGRRLLFFFPPPLWCLKILGEGLIPEDSMCDVAGCNQSLHRAI